MVAGSAHCPSASRNCGYLFICPKGELEYLYSAVSGPDYETSLSRLRGQLRRAEAPPNFLETSLVLQRDLAGHHGMWHRVAIGDLVIAETALHNNLGVVQVDSDYERIAEARPLTLRRLGIGLPGSA